MVIAYYRPRVLPTIVAVIAFAAVAGAQNKSAISSLEPLSKSDRLTVILAGMHEHMGHFSNVRIEAQEVTKSLVDGTFLSTRHQFTLSILKNEYLYDSAAFDGAAVKRRERVWWNGSVSTRLVQVTEPRSLTGVVRQAELDVLGRVFLLDQLGIRRQGSKSSVAEWIDLLIRQKSLDYDLDLVKDGDLELVRLVIKSPSSNRYEFSIDPAHDFIIRSSSRFVPGTQGRVFKDVEMRSSEAQAVDRTWVPRQVLRSHLDELGQVVAEISYSVTSVEFEKVKGPDLAIEFEVGTRVVDEIEGAAYDVTSGRGKRYVPYLNTRTGRVSRGPTTQQSTTEKRP